MDIKKDNRKYKKVKYPNKIQRTLYQIYKRFYRILFGVKIGTTLRGYPKHIHLGQDVRIALNVQFVCTNHDINNPNFVGETKDIFIGDNCLIGANSVILPGVEMGEHTIVGAGTIVHESLNDEIKKGWVVIAGNPAVVKKKII